MALELKSPAFKAQATIPAKHTCDGPDVSPRLEWGDPPEGTKGFCLICDDPDAPMGTWVHWVIYNLPADARELPEDVPKEETLDNGTKQGTNDFGRIGYGGPCHSFDNYCHTSEKIYIHTCGMPKFRYFDRVRRSQWVKQNGLARARTNDLCLKKLPRYQRHQ